ncbi:MAG: PEFG-CTERM sorting domain-containing protein [Thaumarchaeota archaeon]|nr:PEFG-CTERM sorting domain-containing protein [Nitrososphaerota archaeon]
MDKKILYCMFVLALAVPAAAFSQSESLIIIETNDSTYVEGDSIVISGQVSTVIAGTPVTLKIIAEDRLVEVAQLPVAQDGSYSHIINASGDQWSKEGEYLIVASYGEESVETRFDYFPIVVAPETTDSFEVGAGSSGTFDVEYTIRGGTVKNMQIDERNLALVVTIEPTSKGSISLDMPRDAIDAKQSNQSDEIFIILIDGSQVPYTESTRDSDSRFVMIDFEVDDSEIMIIGTWVIPEFGAMAVIVLAVTITAIILLTKNTRMRISI